ncbi:rab GTPase activator, partial [Cryptococcus gattii EJB2]
APTAPPGKARLLYCKAHVAIHPTAFKRDNIPGYLGLVDVGEGVAATHGVAGEGLLVSWVPEQVLARMDAADREGYRRAGEMAAGEREEDGGAVCILRAGDEHLQRARVSGAYFSCPHTSIADREQPSLSHWNGSATINLTGGVSLPTLYFHDDDESPPLLAAPAAGNTAPTPRARWGFPPFLALLAHRAVLVRSKLVHSRQGAELWLVNPSKADREVHEAGVDNDQPEPDVIPKNISATNYPPRPDYPGYPYLDRIDTTNPKQALLTSLSNLTNLSRRKASQILSHPLAQPVVPHLPPAVRSLVNVPGEWESKPAAPNKSAGRKGNNDVASEFESARLYLAKWARIVAEEGERARRSELAAQARIRRSKSTSTSTTPKDEEEEDLASSLGVFSLLPSKAYTKQPIPSPTRTPQNPITLSEWDTWAAQARDELFVRQQIFKRGFSDAEGDKLARREGRTDRNQPIYAVPTSTASKHQESVNKVSERKSEKSEWEDDEEEGGMASLNPHIAALRTILMTYHTFSPELGYVQGMSDLLSPIYVVFDANEGDAFWGLTLAKRINGQEGNFLRDQSGMKKQLSTLQQLISILDPLLYTHLERTDSLNLFFTFRWILIAFKREFPFDTIIHLWEVLWTRYYSDKFVLFVAMAVLESHRDVIIRYLGEFDEVLKYANDLTVSEHLSRILIKRIVIWFPVLWLGRRSITGYDIAPPRRQRRRLIRKGKRRVKFPHRVKVESESEKTVTVTETVTETETETETEGKGKRERKGR